MFSNLHLNTLLSVCSPQKIVGKENQFLILKCVCLNYLWICFSFFRFSNKRVSSPQIYGFKLRYMHVYPHIIFTYSHNFYHFQIIILEYAIFFCSILRFKNIMKLCSVQINSLSPRSTWYINYANFLFSYEHVKLHCLL